MYPSHFEHRQIFQNAYFAIFPLLQNSEIRISNYFSHLRFHTIRVRRTSGRSFGIFCNKVTLVPLPHIDCLFTVIIPVPFIHPSSLIYVSVSLKSEVTSLCIGRTAREQQPSVWIQRHWINIAWFIYLRPDPKDGYSALKPDTIYLQKPL